ncbi:VOC family protein [Dyadobacter sandarakinus]|uniref:VOC family protein n=1 Tax=Dyadobacter sandarakinus TaxID=2747268 RepID=A0ABX7I485_9BACT|nr:VOC family protein [Dyadobacter sandarakinus]QRQ99855.1 VOC family protein [Dyadobacter sandarakinus]
MEKLNLHPYLMFDGNCRAALEFYKGIFGGELNVMTYGDLDGSCPDGVRDQVMHGTLMGGAIDFMAGDAPDGMPLGTGKINLSLSGTDERELRETYEALSEGGTVVVPLDRQMWGDIFGAFQDKFGIDWMMNIRTE